MFKNITDNQKAIIGQEYFKRKIFRRIAEWFSDCLKKYPAGQITKIIKEGKFITDDLEDEIPNIISKEHIIKYMNEITVYRSSMTPEDYKSLIKMIYFHIPEHRRALEENKDWLNEQVIFALCAFDNHVLQIKNEISKSGGKKA
jgi:hypothetical protein